MTEQEKHYFGTDGIRGRVGDGVITPDFILKLGWAVGRVLAKCEQSKVLIGKDTRISGYMFESALQAGLSAAGVDVYLLGPMPTPAIAYLTRTLHAQAGIVISASHNDYHDNGIKFFSEYGTKLPDIIELEIESMLEQNLRTVESTNLGKAHRVNGAMGCYVKFCKGTVPDGIDFTDVKLVVDCAHGATYHVTPRIFRELGADVIVIGAEPNGININHHCGSTAPRLLQAAVLDNQADVGIALDGDGDRLIMVDHEGDLVDGDELLFIIARFQQRKSIGHTEIVGTLMSNLGLEHALSRYDMNLHRANVGDRHVIEKMKKIGGKVGGESSGHIICLDKTTTCDGTVAALQVLSEMIETGSSLHELRDAFIKYPQRLINIKTNNIVDLSTNDDVAKAIKNIKVELGDEGNVLLRASGTEPVVRIMVEGRDIDLIDHMAKNLAKLIETIL